MSDFRLLMLGAMYENGGNTTHRFLDGHPQMFVYPYESQLGTRFVDDALSSMFPKKYRWPAFLLDASPEDDYRASVLDMHPRVSRSTFIVAALLLRTKAEFVPLRRRNRQGSRDKKTSDAATRAEVARAKNSPSVILLSHFCFVPRKNIM